MSMGVSHWTIHTGIVMIPLMHVIDHSLRKCSGVHDVVPAMILKHMKTGILIIGDLFDRPLTGG